MGAKLRCQRFAYLVDGGAVVADLEQVLQVLHSEVAHAHRARFAALQDGLHRLPRLVAGARAAGRVDQVQVDCGLSKPVWVTLENTANIRRSFVARHESSRVRGLPDAWTRYRSTAGLRKPEVG